MTRQGAAILLAMWGLWAGGPAAGGATVRILPEAPTSCDSIRITVTETFSSDCGWWVTPQVAVQEGLISVVLQLHGNDICLPVVREKDLPFTIGPFSAGEYVLSLSWAGREEPPFYSETLHISEGGCVPFIRGDVNADGRHDIGDAVGIALFLFAGKAVACEAAADVDGSEVFDLADPIGLLNYLFAGGPPPVAPFPECGLPPEGAKIFPCEESPCPSPGEPLEWVAIPDGCMQCQPCFAPPLEDVVAALEARGISVFESKYAGMNVCMACDVCPSGRLYAVLVSSSDAAILTKEGWMAWKGRGL
jgi:hypothetical protein